MSHMNQQIILASRPDGEPELNNFKLITTPVPVIKKGEVLVRTLHFSLDPYMRGRMNEGKSYAECFKLNEPLTGGAVCVVVQSKNPDYKEGDVLLTYTGWQTYAVLSAKTLTSDEVHKLPKGVKPSYFLGALGMPGFTAYHGLLEIGQPKKGETVVVSAATGPVGSMVGQIAKSKGCRVVGIAGGPKKGQFAVQELGFDACVDHKSPTFAKDLHKACPKGIDIYYENVGGNVFRAVLPLLNEFARVPICGAVAWYSDGAALMKPGFGPKLFFAKIAAFYRMLFHVDQTPIILLSAIGKRIKYQGFIISDHYEDYDAFLKQTLPLVKSGKIKVKEDIVIGIEKAPQAFIGLLKGGNFGKLIVEIPQDE